MYTMLDYLPLSSYVSGREDWDLPIAPKVQLHRVTSCGMKDISLCVCARVWVMSYFLQLNLIATSFWWLQNKDVVLVELQKDFCPSLFRENWVNKKFLFNLKFI